MHKDCTRRYTSPICGSNRRRRYRPWLTYFGRVQSLTAVAAADKNVSSGISRFTDDIKNANSGDRRGKLKFGKSNDNDDRDSDSDNVYGEEGEHEHDDGPSDSLYKILTGRPQPNPADYAEEPRKVYEIPKTIGGWKAVLSKTWDQYYDTFEGWETEDERQEREQKEKRANGIANEDADEEEDDGVLYEIEIDEDAIKRKQREITDNVGRNINVLSSTGQDLLEQAKGKTGIRTKEDIKHWAGEQMKLMTACLSEFMGGYREGRDEEVDRMLNEYFKELDEAEEAGKDEKGGGEDSHGDAAPDAVEDDDDEKDSKKRRVSLRRRRKRRHH